MSRISLVAALGAAVVVVTLVVTWALWPREQPLGPGGQPVSAGEPAAVAEFLVADPKNAEGRHDTIAFSGDLTVWGQTDKEHSGLFAADVRMHRRFLLQRGGDGELLSSPVLSGRLLVWTLHRSGSGGAVELWAARPPHARPFALISSTRRVNGDEEDGEGGTTEAPARVRLRDLDASANQVVWLERAAVESASGGADDRIWLYDMAAGAASRIMAPAGPKSAVAVDAGLIVWAGRGDNLGVWVHDTATDQRLRVATSLASSVDISGSRVVWSTATGDVYGFDLRTRRRFSVCQAAGMQADVHIDGELIVWWDGRAAHSEGTGSAGGRVRGDIYAFDLSSGKEVAVCTDKAAQESPRVSGDTVVWLDDRSGRWQVRGAIVRR